MDFEKMEKELFRDVYNYLKKFEKPINDDKFWADFVREGGEIEKKYNNKFCRDLIIAVFTYTENKFKYLQKGE